MGVSNINLLVPTGLGLPACGQHTVNFSHLVEVSVSVKQLKDIVMYIPWGGTRTLSQGYSVVSWLFLPCLHIPSLYMSLGSKLMTHFWWQDSWFNLCTEAPFWPPTEHSSTPWTGDYVSSPAHHTSLIKPWGGPCFPSIFKLGQFLDHPLMSMPTLSLHDGTLPQWLIGPWILLFPWSSWTLIVAAHQDFCWGKHLGTSRNTPPTHHHHYKDQSVYF